MLTLKMAFRNVLRQKRRTLLTVLTITGGFVLAAVSIGWSDGSYNVIIDMFTRNQLGHIQVHATGYLDRPTLYKNIDHYETVGETIGRLENVTAWAPRIFAAGLAAVGEKTMAARIQGVDPGRESEATGFDRKITTGRLFSSPDAKEAILGEGLADVLHAGVGDTVVVLSQAADGSMANDAYPIVGLAKSGDTAADQSTLYLGLETAEELFVLAGRVHEIAVVVEELSQVAPTVRAI